MRPPSGWCRQRPEQISFRSGFLSRTRRAFRTSCGPRESQVFAAERISKAVLNRVSPQLWRKARRERHGRISGPPQSTGQHRNLWNPWAFQPRTAARRMLDWSALAEGVSVILSSASIRQCAELRCNPSQFRSDLSFDDRPSSPQSTLAVGASVRAVLGGVQWRKPQTGFRLERPQP